MAATAAAPAAAAAAKTAFAVNLVLKAKAGKAKELADCYRDNPFEYLTKKAGCQYYFVNVNAEKDEVGTLLVFESQEAFAAATAGDEFDAVKAKVMGLLGGPPEVHTFQVHAVFDGKASS